MAKQNKNQEPKGTKRDMVPNVLKSGRSQREINLSLKEKAKEALRTQGHKVQRTEDAITGLSVKERNLYLKEEARAALRKQGHKVSEPERREAKTVREINLEKKAELKGESKQNANVNEDSQAGPGNDPAGDQR